MPEHTNPQPDAPPALSREELARRLLVSSEKLMQAWEDATERLIDAEATREP